MPRFEFQLRQVLELREHRREEAREHLAQALRALQILEGQCRQLEQQRGATRHQRASDARQTNVDVERLISGQRHELALAAQMRTLREQRERVVEEVEKRRGKLVEADRQVQMLERLREQQAAAFAAEADRKEIAEADDIASRQAFRHSQGENS